MVSEGRSPRGKDALGTFITQAILVTVALSRAAFFTGLGLSLFLIAFLGYFTIPFIFLAGALLILAATSTFRTVRRIRGRMR